MSCVKLVGGECEACVWVHRAWRLARHEGMSFRMAPASGANMPEADCLMDEELLTRVTGMQFGLLSPQEIERMAPKVISDNVAHAKNLPKLNGPNDPALGPADRRVRCRTCRDKWYGCMGHPGVIRLPLQVYHAGFIDMTYKLLQAVCHACCRPKCTDTEASATTISAGMALFAFMFGKCKGRIKCPHCGCPQPKYAKAGMSITRTWKPAQVDTLRALSPVLAADALRKFTPTDALDIFINMSDADVRAFGMHPTLAHPAWMILQNVAVLPPNARPAIMAAEGSKRRGQDDITSQTQQILKACKAVRKHVLALFDPTCHERLTNKRKHKETAAAARAAAAAVAAAATAAAPTPAATVPSNSKSSSAANKAAAPEPSQLDESRTAALNERLTAVEFSVAAQANAATSAAHAIARASQLTEPEALATRWALQDDVITLSAAQAAQLWAALPVLCEKLQLAVAIMFDNSLTDGLAKPAGCAETSSRNVSTCPRAQSSNLTRVLTSTSSAYQPHLQLCSPNRKTSTRATLSDSQKQSGEDRAYSAAQPASCSAQA